MNAIDLLITDHRRVKKLLHELDETGERAFRTREDLFRRIKNELTVHEIIEEEIFYPALREHPKAKEIVLEGYEEHNVVDMLMGELSELPVEDETWKPKFTVMMENIEHHVEEEEGEMFAKARQLLDRDELDQLGQAMENRRAEARRDQAA